MIHSVYTGVSSFLLRMLLVGIAVSFGLVFVPTAPTRPQSTINRRSRFDGLAYTKILDKQSKSQLSSTSQRSPNSLEIRNYREVVRDRWGASLPVPCNG